MGRGGNGEAGEWRANWPTQMANSRMRPSISRNRHPSAEAPHAHLPGKPPRPPPAPARPGSLELPLQPFLLPVGSCGLRVGTNGLPTHDFPLPVGKNLLPVGDFLLRSRSEFIPTGSKKSPLGSKKFPTGKAGAPSHSPPHPPGPPNKTGGEAPARRRHRRGAQAAGLALGLRLPGRRTDMASCSIVRLSSLPNICISA